MLDQQSKNLLVKLVLEDGVDVVRRILEDSGWGAINRLDRTQGIWLGLLC